jgi:hypothetical protein
MIDYTKGHNFRDNEKKITQYLLDRKEFYIKSQCRKHLFSYIKRLDSSWNMEVPGSNGNQFMAQLNYALVKQIMINKRALFTGNFRQDPIFTLSAVGNTPDENALNMQELLESNNQQVKFRRKFLVPNITRMVRWGTGIAFSEYSDSTEYGWRTIADPTEISKRVYGPIKESDNAKTYNIDIRNYGQNPDIVSCDESDFNYHMERWSLSTLEAKYKANPDNYIKENIEKVLKNIKKKHFYKDNDYVDADGKESVNDYGSIMISDVTRGRAQIALSNNTDDMTYYYYEMIGDTIIRFQDNPYDMNMNQWTVLTCEPRFEYYWGVTPASYAIQNENSLNLLLGMSIENAIQSMNRQVFYNKNAIDPREFQNAAFNGKIGVDVAKDVSLNNILYQHQPQDTAGREVGDAYARILENNQRTTTTPDLNRNPSQGGPSNKTATAANIMESVGANEEADILERYSHSLSYVGEKALIIIGQYFANFGPVLVRPDKFDSIREIHKAQMTGNFSVNVDTSLQRSYNGDIQELQNLTVWLQNLAQTQAIQMPNFQPMVKHVLKMSKMMNVDKILPDQQEIQGGVPSQQMPGQELAGPGQEMLQL